MPDVLEQVASSNSLFKYIDEMVLNPSEYTVNRAAPPGSKVYHSVIKKYTHTNFLHVYFVSEVVVLDNDESADFLLVSNTHTHRAKQQ